MSACHTRTHARAGDGVWLQVRAGVRGCQCACVSECVICVSASAIVSGWERATGRGGGCGRCPRGRPRLSLGCRRHRGLGGCQGGRVVSPGVWRGGWVPAAERGPRSAQSSLPLSSPPRRAAVCITLAASVCACVLGGSLGMWGSLSHLPKQRRRRCLWLPTPGVDSGANGEAPGEGTGRAGGRDPQPPGGGAAAHRSALCCLGLRASPSLPPSARSVRLGVGMSQRRPPLASHGNLGGGDSAPPPPGAGLRELRGALGADSPALSTPPPSPRLTRPPSALLESGGEWRVRR